MALTRRGLRAAAVIRTVLALAAVAVPTVLVPTIVCALTGGVS